MFRRVLPLTVVTIALATAGAADKPTPAKLPKDEVEKTIKQLGDDKFSARLAALKELERLGPEILPLLKEAFRTSKDPEVRRRIEEMLPIKEHAAALSPNRITLSAKERPVKEVIAEFAKQTGYKFDLVPQGDQREKKAVTLELDEVPFWEALEKACEVCGVYFQEGWYGGEQQSLRLEYGDVGPGYVCFQGPFRVTARGFNYSRNVEFANGVRRGPQPAQPINRTEYLSVNFNVTVEPKLPMLSAGQPTITEALDENGQSMAPPQQSHTHYSYYHGYRSFTHQVQAQLTPTKGAAKIRSLKGTVPITAIAAQREKLSIDKIMEVKSQTCKAGTTTLTIESVTKSGEEVEIKMSISEGGGRNDPVRLNSMAQRFSLLDDKGNKFYGYMSRWSGQNNGGNGTLRFHGNGQNVTEPVKLVFYEWTTVTHAVPFDFRDLPLP